MKSRTIYRKTKVEWMKQRIKLIIYNIKKKKNNQSEQQEEKIIQKYENSVSSLWDNFKHSNICIIGVPQCEEKEL